MQKQYIHFRCARRVVSALVATVFVFSCVAGLCACGGTQEVVLSPTEMRDVIPSALEGLGSKVVADSYKAQLAKTVTLTPAFGRTISLERYDSAVDDWVVEQTYETPDEESAELTIDFGDKWRQHASSRWRLHALAIRDAGPERETYGEVSEETKVVNKFIDCQAAVVMDAQSGNVVYDYNATKQRKIASMTKMMSAILLVENKQPTDKIKITKKIWQTEYSFGFSKGDELTVEQVLYGMMLPSANDAAAAAAYGVSGSIEKFSEAMNAKAKEIGCTSSVFKNPHGLDAQGEQHSTALDTARIGSYIMTSDTCSLVRDAVKTKRYDFTVKTKTITTDKTTGKKKKTTRTSAYSLENTNDMLNKKDNAIGLKTGYTGEAGFCFCGAFEIEGKPYVTVVMGAEDPDVRWTGTRKLVKFTKYALESGFEPFEM